jgi:hypothetical protein
MRRLSLYQIVYCWAPFSDKASRVLFYLPCTAGYGGVQSPRPLHLPATRLPFVVSIQNPEPGAVQLWNQPQRVSLPSHKSIPVSIRFRCVCRCLGSGIGLLRFTPPLFRGRVLFSADRPATPNLRTCEGRAEWATHGLLDSEGWSLMLVSTQFPESNMKIKARTRWRYFSSKHPSPTMSDTPQQWPEQEPWLYEQQQQGGGQGRTAQPSSNSSYSPHSSTSDLSSSSHCSYPWAYGGAPFDASTVSAWVGPRKSLTLFYVAKINPILPKTLLSLIIPPPLDSSMVQLLITPPPPPMASTARTTSAAIQWEPFANPVRYSTSYRSRPGGICMKWSHEIQPLVNRCW